jgi:hypothetical protein
METTRNDGDDNEAEIRLKDRIERIYEYVSI